MSFYRNGLSWLFRIILTFGAFKTVQLMSFRFESSLRPFDGSGSWPLWFDRFETVASFCKWEDDDKARYLMIYLEGVPLRIAHQLPESSRKSWEAIASRLRDAFQPSAQESHQLLLRRKWQAGQSVEELYYDLVMLWRGSIGAAASTLTEQAQTAAVVPFFYSALPMEVSRQLRLLELPLDNADALLRHARTLISCFTESEHEPAVIAAVRPNNAPMREIGGRKGRKRCKRCWSDQHVEAGCRFSKPVCRTCFQEGHFAKDCQSSKNGRVSDTWSGPVARPRQ